MSLEIFYIRNHGTQLKHRFGQERIGTYGRGANALLRTRNHLTLQPPFLQLPFLSPQLSVQRASSRVLEHLEQMVVLAEILTLFHTDGSASLAFATAIYWHFYTIIYYLKTYKSFTTRTGISHAHYLPLRFTSGHEPR